ncbi:helicase-exonuclease AddAB subunit AddA [Clostridium sp. UBA1056]|uniref:helicase-exonuclease AddAB subunit AddA n=1 Tax=unclassified Clostridium TaxID=2614128 RepID=UPI0032166648
MSSVKWTEEQQKAINIRYRNTLVSAAAGSGKTAVLVERIIKIITDRDNPVDIDKLLIVTFTNAAAAEMRERIGEAINKRIKEEPNNRNLQTQLILLNKASISTLHSFCLNLIKNNFHQLDIEPNFRVGDTTEINLLKVEALEELMESKYIEGKEEFIQLVESYCGNKSDRALAEMVLRLYNFSMSMGDPVAWLREKSELFNVGEDFSFESLHFKDALLKELREDIINALEINNEGLDFVLNNPILDKYKATFENDGEILERTLTIIEEGLKEETKYIEEATFGRIPTLTKLTEEEKIIQKQAKDLRDAAKGIYVDVRSKILNATSEDNIKITRRLYPLMKELVSLVIEFKDIFDKSKRERGIIDFNDQEHFALEILRDKEVKNEPSNIALELKNKFEEILVDEYQDSNNVQEEIINLICRTEKDTRNVFMVGDLKQSIYRFRMAKPELFKSKKESYTKDGDDYNALITLHKNFRSRKEVIDGINYIFKAVMSEDVGELSYDGGEELKVGATYKEFTGEGNVGGDVEFNLINLDKEIEEDKEEKEEKEEIQEQSDEAGSEEELDKEELDSMQLEARFVARRIRELMDLEGENSLKVYDKNLDDYRRATYKDIVILLRSSNKLSPIFIEEFKRVGIPLFSEGEGGYFDTLEVKTVISVLEIIDNPIQDIPLIAVLRSPIGGFTTEELADIRISNKNVSFYHAMVGLLSYEEKVYEEEKFTDISKEIYNNTNLKLKIKGFLDKINNWRLESKYTPINQLIWEIITDTGYYGYVGALPGGEQRQANLKILFKRAKDFERTSYRGLYNFINFINNIKTSSEDMGSAKIIGENEDVVRIMSIHKSKGLEFPIVFLCGLGKRFNEGDLKGKILFHHELGFGPTYIDLDHRISYNTPQREFISKKIQGENKSEEMRLLYVALTRAKEKLILVGSSKALEKKIEKWSGAGIDDGGNIKSSYVRNQKNYMDWIGAALINHKGGEFLRHYNENILKEDLKEDNSRFKVAIYTRESFEEAEDIILEDVPVKEKIDKLLVSNDEKLCKDYYEAIKERLEFTYKYEEATKLPTVITVTELKELEKNKLLGDNEKNDLFIDNNDLNEDAYKDLNYDEEVEGARKFRPLMQTPLFLQEKKGLTPSEVGTAYHNIMQRLDLSGDLTKEDITSQVNAMVENELITFEAAKSVKVDKILKFLQSNIGKKIIESYKENTLKRELPFRVEINASTICPNINEEKYSEEKMLLRGVIDCYFEYGEEGIILDYKTDYVKENNIEEIKARYKVQLDYYSNAVKNAFKKEKVKKYLYLFSLDREVEVE